MGKGPSRFGVPQVRPPRAWVLQGRGSSQVVAGKERPERLQEMVRLLRSTNIVYPMHAAEVSLSLEVLRVLHAACVDL